MSYVKWTRGPCANECERTVLRPSNGHPVICRTCESREYRRTHPDYYTIYKRRRRRDKPSRDWDNLLNRLAMALRRHPEREDAYLEALRREATELAERYAAARQRKPWAGGGPPGVYLRRVVAFGYGEARVLAYESVGIR